MRATDSKTTRNRAERSDSRRNRAVLVDAAKLVFSQDGLDASLDRIAATAGVGIGTLYRHFPTRSDLWIAVLSEPLSHQVQLLDRALADSDPWRGFSEYLISSCAAEAAGDGYLQLLTTHFDQAPELLKTRREIQILFENLFARAQEAGEIRSDVTSGDLLFLMLANSRIIQVTGHIAPLAWRRNVELFLDSLRPTNQSHLSVPPLKPHQLFRSLMKRPRTRMADSQGQSGRK